MSQESNHEQIGLLEHAAFDSNISGNCNKLLVRLKNSDDFIRHSYKPQRAIGEVRSLQILSNYLSI